MLTDTQTRLLFLTAAAIHGDAEKYSTSPELINEANVNGILPLVYSVLDENSKLFARALFSRCITRIMRVADEHRLYSSVLNDAGINYCIIKGLSCSEYYPDPKLRMLGDTDILVKKCDFEDACNAFLASGFAENDNFGADYHRVFSLENRGKIELHNSINGIPTCNEGKILAEYLENSVDTAQKSGLPNLGFAVPDKFHHGLILLTHMANHILQSGIGLRQLCDWAVFCDSMSDEEFFSLFYEPLKKCGLWKFAGIMTDLSVKYLKIDEKASVKSEISPEYLEELMTDILSAGNFGQKNPSRLNSSKLVADKSHGKVDEKNMVCQLFSSLKDKAIRKYEFCRKYPPLLPLGVLLALFIYIIKIFRGKKPAIHPSKMIADAEIRRKIYSEFELFDGK